MRECSEIGLMLSAYSDGELEPQARHRIENHLALCATCIAELSDYSRLRRQLGAAIEIPNLDGFARSVLSKLGKLVVVAFCAMLLRGGVPVQNRSAVVDVQIDSIVVVEANEGTTESEVIHRDWQVDSGKRVVFKLPGAQRLSIRARAIDHGMIAMEVVIYDGAQPTMRFVGSLQSGSPWYFSGKDGISIRISPRALIDASSRESRPSRAG